MALKNFSNIRDCNVIYRIILRYGWFWLNRRTWRWVTTQERRGKISCNLNVWWTKRGVWSAFPGSWLNNWVDHGGRKHKVKGSVSQPKHSQQWFHARLWNIYTYFWVGETPTTVDSSSSTMCQSLQYCRYSGFVLTILHYITEMFCLRNE